MWLLTVALAVLATTVLSLDTTAVLLTPVVLAAARRLALPPYLFAMTTVWLANTASLLLSVANLPALHRLSQFEVGLRGYLAMTWAPGLVSVLVTVAALVALFRRTLR